MADLEALEKAQKEKRKDANKVKESDIIKEEELEESAGDTHSAMKSVIRKT